MLRTCLIFCGLVLSDSALADGTADFCAHLWKSNYVMRESCQTEQTVAAFNLKLVVEQPQVQANKNMREIFAHCLSLWREDEFKTHNWAMVTVCYDEQTAAYKRFSNIR